MKKFVIIISSVIFLLVIGFVLIANKLDSDVQMILDHQINELSLVDVEDGTYIGEFNEALAVQAKVEVTVEEHKIVKIAIIEHKNGKGSAAEIIVENILDEQSVLVDDIAGATYSSRVLKLAVINALEGE